MIKKITLYLMLLTIIAFPIYAQSIPKYFNYQAVLFDDGGNPLSDGPTILNIKILDESMGIVYEEEQEVEIVSGIASVMIGSGVNPYDSVPTGGVDIEAIKPDGSRYLEVQAEGYPAETLLEIVSVPYSTYADIALNVANRTIDSAKIKEGSIKMEHFTDNLLSEIEDRIIGEDDSRIVVMRDEFSNYKNTISNSSGAQNVGVISDFSNSNAKNIQDVLSDFDLSIRKRAEETKIIYNELESNQSSYDSHTNNRNNPHQVTAAQTGAATASSLNSHVNNRNNPHRVTPVQIGAATPQYVDDAIAAIDIPDFGLSDIPDGSLGLRKIGTIAAEGSASVDRNGAISITSGPCYVAQGGIRCDLNSRQYNPSLDTGYSALYIPVFRFTVNSLGYYKPSLSVSDYNHVSYLYGGGSDGSPGFWQEYFLFQLQGNGGSNGANLYWKIYRVNE